MCMCQRLKNAEDRVKKLEERCRAMDVPKDRTLFWFGKYQEHDLKIKALEAELRESRRAANAPPEKKIEKLEAELCCSRNYISNYSKQVQRRDSEIQQLQREVIKLDAERHRLSDELFDEKRECNKLRKAVGQLYFSAYWTPDRECNASSLWKEVRDAARLPMGQSPKPITNDSEVRRLRDELVIAEDKCLELRRTVDRLGDAINAQEAKFQRLLAAMNTVYEDFVAE